MSRLSGKNHLMVLTKELLRAWEATRVSWRDEKADEFEGEYLKDLESGVNRAIHGIEKLDERLLRVRKDCG